MNDRHIVFGSLACIVFVVTGFVLYERWRDHR
jgi:hypothetical protein